MLVRRWAPFVERLLTGVGAVIPIWLGRVTTHSEEGVIAAQSNSVV
jgi:hypothetical protein